MPELTRSESLESIPGVDFIVASVEADLAALEMNDVSEYKKKEAAGELLPEPLLIPDNSRFVLFPIKHGDVSNGTCAFICFFIFFSIQIRHHSMVSFFLFLICYI
jgi:hypothetical protein